MNDEIWNSRWTPEDTEGEHMQDSEGDKDMASLLVALRQCGSGEIGPWSR